MPINRIRGAWSNDDWYGPVTFDGRPLSPARSLRLANHSPDGFAWGYGGSGPAQLALAILLEAGCTNEQALQHYRVFVLTFLDSHVLDNNAAMSFDLDVMAWVSRRDEICLITDLTDREIEP